MVAGVGGYGNCVRRADRRRRDRASTPATTATSWSTPWRSASRDADKIFYAAASRRRQCRSSIVGSKTGRDGIHGATDGVGRIRRRQRGEAPDRAGRRSVHREAAARGLPRAHGERTPSIAIQDMGAAGLTCSAVEMGAKGDLGIELDLDKVPTARDRHDAPTR
ncbi:MAG: AIR synthase-related protein [Rhodopseudomonas palustris]|nr:AIR synthase-related protein [Rhodopseudomonas palustris]